MSLSDSLAGVLGGVAGTVVGQPFDLIKVRMQTGDGKLGSSPISVLIKIVRNEMQIKNTTYREFGPFFEE